MSTENIFLFARWQVKEGLIDAVLKSLESAATASRREEGNLFYKIHQSNTDQNTIVLYEGYANPAALEYHRNSEHFKTYVLGEIVPNLEGRDVVVSSQLQIGEGA